MRAMAPEVTARYQRAADLLDDVLAARTAAQPRRTPAEAAGGRPERTGRAARATMPTSIQTPAPRARSARGAVLLAVPQAAARAHGSVSVL